MTIRLNDAGARRAAELIAAGHVDRESQRFEVQRGGMATSSGSDPPEVVDANSFLGLKTGVNRNESGAYAYQFEECGKVLRSALLHIRAQSFGLGHSLIHAAAGKLLAAIDGDDAEHSRRELLEALDCGSHSIELDADAWASTTEKVVQLLPFGDITGIDGRQLRVTEWSLESIRNRFAARENQLLLDYDHSSIYAYGEPGSSLAAGWIFDIWGVAPETDVATLDGLYGEGATAKAEAGGPGVYARVKLVEAAAEKVRALEYRYLSPVVDWVGDDHEVSEVMMAALTNDPNLDGMLPIAASRTPDVPRGTLNVDENTNNRPQAGDSTEPEPPKGDDMSEPDWAALARARGIKTPVTDETSFTAALSKMQSEAEALAARNQELEAKARTADAEKLVDKAIIDRLVSESQKAFFVNMAAEHPAQFEAYMKTAEKLPEPPKPPQGRETKSDSGADSIPSSDGPVRVPAQMFSAKARLHVSQESLAEANAEIAKMKANHNGNTADALRAMSQRQVLA